MIKLEKTRVFGFEAAIGAMRDPKESWDRSDSKYCVEVTTCPEGCMLKYTKQCGYGYVNNHLDTTYSIGPNDHDLAMRLAKGGAVHATYRRQIDVWVNITAPLYWWKEFERYIIGSVPYPFDTSKVSCSTMHTIHKRPFTVEDFSCNHVMNRTINTSTLTEIGMAVNPRYVLDNTIDTLNALREVYLATKNKEYWYAIIQMLPSSYNQMRSYHLNYEVLSKIYLERKTHKLDEWIEFCDWIETLPYSEFITLKEAKEGETE